MSTNKTEWERLNCTFFETVVRKTFDSYFAEQGFGVNSQTSVGGVVYLQGNVFVEISYEPETYPKYSPKILLGIGRNGDDSKWRLSAIPVWFFIPSNRPESKYPFWKFDTEAGLVEVLKRIRYELLEIYTKSLWNDVSELSKIIEAFKAKS